MSDTSGGHADLPDLQHFVSEGDGQVSGHEQDVARGPSQGRVWSDEEWREWNQWHWGRGSYGSTYWSWSVSGGAAEGGNEAETSGGRSSAAANPSGDSRAPDPLWLQDPWQQSSGSWDNRQNEKWWSGTHTKGDYADPPSWPGWGYYRLWRRALLRWDANTDVAQYRRAEKILKSLDWEMQAKLDHLSEETLASAGYLVSIFQVLDVLAGEREDLDKRRSIRAALYEGNRKADETLAQYALRRESQFTSVSKYLPLPDELKAIMLEEQSGLSKQGTQNLRVLTEGKHDYAKVRKALQVLDTEEESLFKGKGNYLIAEESQSGSEDNEEDFIDEETFHTIKEKDMDEDELMSFLAHNGGPRRRTWSENKQLKAARKKDRRHFEDRQTRPDRPPGFRRLPISELKKVTRCSNCGEKGHWKEECEKPYRSRSAREKTERSGGAGNTFVFLGRSNASQFEGAFLNFECLAEDSSFSFMSLPVGHAIVDPGASQDLIGFKSFQKLSDALLRNGLKPIRLEEAPAPASGVGGDARPLFNALVPCVLGGKPGIVKLTVVEENIPQLLSAGLLEHAGAVIDMSQNKIMFENLGSSVDMTRLSSGHRIIDVSSWHGKSFPVPEQLVKQFNLKPGAFDSSDSATPAEYMPSSAAGQSLLTVLSKENCLDILKKSEDCGT